MRAIIERFKIKEYKFIVEFDSGGEIGGEIRVWIEVGDNSLIDRIFYFDNEGKGIRGFANKFVNDLTYQKSCLNGSVDWVRIHEWFSCNGYIYGNRFMTQKAVSNKKSLKAMENERKGVEIKLLKLYKLISNKIEELENSPEFKEHLLIESQTPEPSMGVIDGEIERVVIGLNKIPGIITQFSCEGIRRGLKIAEWEYGPIWFPGKHEPVAYVQFTKIPLEIAEKFDKELRQKKVGFFQFNRVQANISENNKLFIDSLEQILKESDNY